MYLIFPKIFCIVMVSFGENAVLPLLSQQSNSKISREGGNKKKRPAGKMLSKVSPGLLGNVDLPMQRRVLGFE